MTAAEYVGRLRAHGNSVLLADERVFIGDFDNRLKVWVDRCRERGGRYIDEVREFLAAEAI